jgi:hypothetical protein
VDEDFDGFFEEDGLIVSFVINMKKFPNASKKI